MILSAGFERKFNKKLITCSIFPQEGGKPVINPSGKYCIRLHINGCWRRILIDTHLPYGSHDRKLCSYSADHSELWVSLIEKAYMKARDLHPRRGPGGWSGESHAHFLGVYGLEIPGKGHGWI